MTRDTLLDFFDDRIRSAAPFVVHDDGYRARAWTYDDVRRAAAAFARRLAAAGIGPGEKVAVWGENSPDWIAALWGCLLARAVLVPVDFRASGELLARVAAIVDARAVLVGDGLQAPPLPDGVAIWPLQRLMTPAADADDRAEGSPSGAAPAAGGRADRGAPGDLAEIIFTSGATDNPKGVRLTHRNILANVVPVEREVVKHRRYARPFAPLRFLNLLPLSHMFGQAMATFVPPMLSGVTVFMRGHNPADVIAQVRKRRVSVVVCVPKILEVLRDHLVRLDPALAAAAAPESAARPAGPVALRWWRHRRVHRTFGCKFWAFVVGAAPLDPDLEAFWSRLGFLVVQGYGLTETAPIVTLNHPLRARRGTVGTPIGGVEVKIADDGEILVRGENVTDGYYGAAGETAAAFEDGWFRTGDVGSRDAAGRLTVRGRKKEVIVTPEGLNVFPEDVERALSAVAGVREAGVVGVSRQGREQVHAVLALEPGADPAAVLGAANLRLEEHQKIRSRSIWPGGALPRTEGTRKLKRRELKRWVEAGGTTGGAQAAGAGDAAGGAPESAAAVVRRFAPDRPVTGETRLEEIGLSSIERIELLMALEQAFDRTIDEMAFAAATTVADLQRLAAGTGGPDAAPDAPPAAEPFDFPAWSRSRPARLVRRLALGCWLLPLTRLFARIEVEGLRHLDAAPGPVVYAANHQSHLDAPVILAALPPRRRYAVATAAAKEFFAAHFGVERRPRRRRLTNSLNYYLASLLFNVFPLPQREAGARGAIRYLGGLLDEGASVLIFPEGRRTDAGEIGPFLPGIGMVAARLRAPIVPVRLEGLDRVLHKSWRMAAPGRVRVAFGPPLDLGDGPYPELARRVEEAVRAL